MTDSTAGQFPGLATPGLRQPAVHRVAEPPTADHPGDHQSTSVVSKSVSKISSRRVVLIPPDWRHLWRRCRCGGYVPPGSSSVA